jgi:hypothetical protein
MSSTLKQRTDKSKGSINGKILSLGLLVISYYIKTQ